MSQYIEKEGRTPEEALELALEELGVSRDQVIVKVLSEGTKGILGLGAKMAKVRVTLKDDPYATPEHVLKRLIGLMNVDCEIEGETIDGVVHINISSPDAGLIIGRRGETLQALQFILNNIVNRKSLIKRRVVLDAGGFREKRRQVLTEMAQRLAEKVKATGRDVALEPMPAHERRIIHIALQDDPDVRTFSRGEGDNRYVLITLRDKNADEQE